MTTDQEMVEKYLSSWMGKDLVGRYNLQTEGVWGIWSADDAEKYVIDYYRGTLIMVIWEAVKHEYFTSYSEYNEFGIIEKIEIKELDIGSQLYYK